ncbi:HNH endonuclease [Pollutimonas subterranea]|nr:HNH endonuclease [Pollutimonas subterranea]
MKCQICLRHFNALRFKTKRIQICRFCVEDLNAYRTVAQSSFVFFEEKLRLGMTKSMLRGEMPDASYEEQKRSKRLRKTFDGELAKALPSWLNRRAADHDRFGREHKLLRAHRRNLLFRQRPKSWKRPTNWETNAQSIRLEDGRECNVCRACNTELHVHHIVYKSNFGTNNKANLVTLCRRCHEEEHGRKFNFGQELNQDDWDDTVKEAVKHTGSTEYWEETQVPPTPNTDLAHAARENTPGDKPTCFEASKPTCTSPMGDGRSPHEIAQRTDPPPVVVAPDHNTGRKSDMAKTSTSHTLSFLNRLGAYIGTILLYVVATIIVLLLLGLYGSLAGAVLAVGNPATIEVPENSASLKDIVRITLVSGTTILGSFLVNLRISKNANPRWVAAVFSCAFVLYLGLQLISIMMGFVLA